MHSLRPQDIAPSLRREGWQMLCCLGKQFHNAGHSVSTVFDQRILDQTHMVQLGRWFHSPVSFQAQAMDKISPSSPLSPLDLTLDIWQQAAKSCNVTVVVAPELDGALESCINYLENAGISLLNCTGSFLTAACDKLQTAECLHRHAVPHPRTWSVEDFSVADLALAQRWCIKPRWGAGCEGLQIFDAGRASRVLANLPSQSSSIIQPWTEGRSFSCSAVVSQNGDITWLPLVTQEFLVTQQSLEGQLSSSIEGLRYNGAKLAPTELQEGFPLELLNQTLRVLAGSHAADMLGWIGVDLVLDNSGRWSVIEVNSRLTTSAVELCNLGHGNWARQMLTSFGRQSL